MYRVYIADDAALVRKELALTTPWEKLGCVLVGQAEDGRQALAEIISLKPDIVITDIKMPYLGGLELIHAAKEQGSQAEFILISAYSEFEYALHGIKLEVLDYILKPIADDELEHTIRRTVERIRHKRGQGGALLPLFDVDIQSVNAHLRKAVSYIRAHFREELSVKQVAEYLLISESYLGKLFKVEINATFVEYLTRVRMFEALQLLKDKNKPIYEIAELVGYKDYRYFSMIFKKMIGLTPKEFQAKS